MNIKNPETERLIRELAAVTGEGQTEAVTKAVRERLERVREKGREGIAEKLLAIGREMAPYMRDAPDIDDLLYDPDTGLPKR